MTHQRQVAVTGIGWMTPAGRTIEQVWERVVGGHSTIGPVCNIPTDRLNCRLLAEIVDFDPLDHFEQRHAAAMDRVAQLAVLAARDAVGDSALALDTREPNNVGVVIGSGVGGLISLENSYQTFYGPSLGRPHPMTVPKSMINAPASHVSMDLGLQGPAFCIASACASGTHAIGQAAHLVRHGQADVVLAGGVDASLTVGTIKAWEALRVLTSDTCRPFCATRSGLVLGEAACVLVLEELDHARRRGAKVYGLIEGFGMSADAGGLTSPSADGAALAIRRALADAALSPADIGYINAHGTGTVINDRVESIAIRTVFGTAADAVLISSTKGVLGHSLGATGAVEAAISLLALQRQIAPPTANLLERDPDCLNGAISNQAILSNVQWALSNSFAFGGLNAVLAIGRRPTYD